MVDVLGGAGCWVGDSLYVLCWSYAFSLITVVMYSVSRFVVWVTLSVSTMDVF